MSYNSLGTLAEDFATSTRWRIARRKLMTSRCLLWLAPFSVLGCLTEFPPLTIRPAETNDPTDESSSSGGNTSSGSGASTLPSDGGPMDDGGSSTPTTGASSETGSSSSHTGDISCGEGEVPCGNTCVRGNSCCGTNCEAPHADSECRDGECVITTCETDYFDCDGEAANGCETSMPTTSAPPATEDEPLVIPRFNYEEGIAAITQTAWEGLPRYNLRGSCSTCERNGQPEEVPPITPSENRGVFPPTNDARGSFSLAWNELGLWVNVVIVDDQWATGDDVGETDARAYDNVMLIWDSAAGESDAGSGDDRLLFAGVDGQMTDWRQTHTNGAAIRVLGAGQCRSVHLQLSSRYLFMGSGGSDLLAAGDQHALNVAYNDYDWVQEDALIAQRQHFLFGLPMSFSSGDYYTGTRVLPQIELGAQ